MRLGASDELLTDLFRRQLADVERVKSQIDDLSGLCRGRVSIACSQALLSLFLAAANPKLSTRTPNVTFQITVKDGRAAEKDLLDYSADLALIYQSLPMNDFQTILTMPQPVNAILSKTHPLADRKALKFSECLDYPLAFPAKTCAVRNVLDVIAARYDIKLEPAVEAESFILLRNFAALGEAIAFEIQIGAPSELMSPDIAIIPLELTGESIGYLHLAQLRGRTLSAAAASFANQLSNYLNA